MRFVTVTLRYLTFLTVAGSIRARDYWIGAAFIILAAAARHSSSIPTPALVPTYLLIVPILAGSALLDIAREGRLDLLFASGASRQGVWKVAVARVLLFHTVVVLIMVALLPGAGTPARLVILTMIVLGNAALGFAGGLIRPAAGFGIVWFAARVLFALVPQIGLLRLHMIDVDEGRVTAVAWKLLATVLLLPESTVSRSNLPLYVPFTYLCVASAALLLSYMVFVRASFPGRRRE